MTYDLVIIGAGPIGLYAAFYAGMRRLSVAIVDIMPEVGGQLTAFYPSQDIYDVPGLAGKNAQAVVAALLDQANLANPTWHLQCELLEVQPSASPPTLQLQTSTGTLFAKSVLLTMGVGALRPRTVAPPLLEPWVGRGVCYACPDPATLAGKAITIAVGSEGALVRARELHAARCAVTLLNRRPLTNLPTGIKQISAGEIALLEGDAALTAVHINHPADKNPLRLPTDLLLIQAGYDIDLSLLARLDLKRVGHAIAVDHTMQTSRPRIYAAGDICSYPGKLKLIACGFSEAAIAVNHLCRQLDPSTALFPGHSTSVAKKRLPRLLQHESAS